MYKINDCFFFEFIDRALIKVSTYKVSTKLVHFQIYQGNETNLIIDTIRNSLFLQVATYRYKNNSHSHPTKILIHYYNLR